MPAGEHLVAGATTGQADRLTATMTFEGPFDLTLSQSLAPPVVSPDPTGATRIFIDLYPDVRATLIEANDGSRHAYYNLLWEREGIYYQIVASGPPQTRRQILDIALSLGGWAAFEP